MVGVSEADGAGGAMLGENIDVDDTERIFTQ